MDTEASDSLSSFEILHNDVIDNSGVIETVGSNAFDSVLAAESRGTHGTTMYPLEMACMEPEETGTKIFLPQKDLTSTQHMTQQPLCLDIQAGAGGTAAPHLTLQESGGKPHPQFECSAQLPEGSGPGDTSQRQVTVQTGPTSTLQQELQEPLSELPVKQSGSPTMPQQISQEPLFQLPDLQSGSPTPPQQDLKEPLSQFPTSPQPQAEPYHLSAPGESRSGTEPGQLSGPGETLSGTESQDTPVPLPRKRKPCSSSCSSQANPEVLLRSDAAGLGEDSGRGRQSPDAEDSMPVSLLHSDPVVQHGKQCQGKDTDREYSVLLIGKTGNGKSSLANTITGTRDFKQGRGLFVTTRDTKAMSATVGGRRLKVIDTADFTNILNDAASHIQQWKEHTHSSPDVIMLVVRCDVRYTKEEHAIYQEIVKLWGDPSLFRQRLMVAFTFGDLQDEDLGEELKTVNEELKSVLGDAQNRYVQINNRVRGEQEKEKQLDDVCRVISDVIKHGVEKEILMLEEPSGTTCQQNQAVLIVGKTGQGKSSVGNLLTGTPDSFSVAPGLITVTTASKSVYTDLGNGIRLKVIDTPSLRTLDPTSKHQEIDHWKKMMIPRTGVILLVIRCDIRLTPDELADYHDVKKFWTAEDREDPLFSTHRVIVVFTFCDSRDYNLEMQLEMCAELKEVLTEAEWVYLEIDNKASEEIKQVYRHILLSLIHSKVLSGESRDHVSFHEKGGVPAAVHYTKNNSGQLRPHMDGHTRGAATATSPFTKAGTAAETTASTTTRTAAAAKASTAAATTASTTAATKASTTAGTAAAIKASTAAGAAAGKNNKNSCSPI